MSLRLQINIGILLSVSIILLLGGATVVWQARQSVAEEVGSSVNLAHRLIRSNLNADVIQHGELKVWLAQIELLRHTRHLKIQIKDAEGRLLEQFASQSSAVAPFAPSWYIWMIAQPYESVSFTVRTETEAPVTINIDAEPMDEIRESWQETRAFMLFIGLMAGLLFIAVNLIFNKALGSVDVIVQGLQAIENGRYQHRIPDFKVSEFAMIARAVNHLTEALAQAKKDNKALTQHSLKIQEQERQQLAKELHDEMGQSVAAIKAMAMSGKQAQADNDSINNSIIAVCDHVFLVVRSMMRNLHPMLLTELGLKASLQDLIENWSEKQKDTTYQFYCIDAVDEFDDKTAIQVFRVIQECLTNVARHAQASRVNISLLQVEDSQRIRVQVDDNGQGCDPALLNSGFGVMAIRERIEHIGGQAQFDSAPGQGMRVALTIPMGTEEHCVV